MSDIDTWASLRAACEKYGATSMTVPALVDAIESRLRVEIGEQLDEPTTCKVWMHGRLVFCGQDHTAALRAAQPTVCPDCGHQHTPDGCTGEPTASDRWAGVGPTACDCVAQPTEGES